MSDGSPATMITIVKYIVFLFNLVFFAAGLGLTIMGGIVLAVYNEHEEFIPGESSAKMME